MDIDFNALQDVKTPPSILVVVLGMSIDSNDEQRANASVLIVVTPVAGIFTVVKYSHILKASIPISFTLAGIVTDVNELLFSNAPFIVSVPSGIVTSASDPRYNAKVLKLASS